jgi:hypothetical protein
VLDFLVWGFSRAFLRLAARPRPSGVRFPETSRSEIVFNWEFVGLSELGLRLRILGQGLILLNGDDSVLPRLGEKLGGGDLALVPIPTVQGGRLRDQGSCVRRLRGSSVEDDGSNRLVRLLERRRYLIFLGELLAIGVYPPYPLRHCVMTTQWCDRGHRPRGTACSHG